MTTVRVGATQPKGRLVDEKLTDPEAALTAVPTRGRTTVVIQRDADVGPVEVWARSEVTVRDPDGTEVECYEGNNFGLQPNVACDTVD